MDIDLKGWIDHLRGECGCSPHTIRAYKSNLSSLSSFLAEKHKTLLETIDKLKDGKRNTFNCPEWHNPIADTALEIVKCQAQKIKALEKTINDK